jgi:hypothetical protein
MMYHYGKLQDPGPTAQSGETGNRHCKHCFCKQGGFSTRGIKPTAKNICSEGPYRSILGFESRTESGGGFHVPLVVHKPIVFVSRQTSSTSYYLNVMLLLDTLCILTNILLNYGISANFCLLRNYIVASISSI